MTVRCTIGESLSELPRRRRQRKNAEQVKKQPGSLPGETNRAGRRQQVDREFSLYVTEQELKRRQGYETLARGLVHQSTLRLPPLPVRVDRLDGINTRPLTSGDGAGLLGYVRHHDRDRGEDLYRLVKVAQVAGRRCRLLAFDDGGQINRVSIDCVVVVEFC